MTLAYPGGWNTWIPNADLRDPGETVTLVVNFSRNPSAFALPRWASYTSVKYPKGFYLRLDLDEMARMLDVTNNNNIWPLGNDRPQLTWGLSGFNWQSFTAARYAYGYVLPYEAQQQAAWPVEPQNNAAQAMKAMTSRANVCITTATTTGNYDSSHVDTATNWGGGYLNAGTAANPIFRRALETMFRRIHLDTRGCVAPNDMLVVMNPATAHVISQSAEISDFVKSSPFALAQVKGTDPGQTGQWYLPPVFAGFNIVVDDTVINPNAKGSSTQTGVYAWPWATVAMFARPGGLMAPEGATSFSTVHVWLKEDMTVESFDDPINRRRLGSIVDFFGCDVVAPVSGALCTSSLQTQPSASLPTAPDAGGDLVMGTGQDLHELQKKTLGIHPDRQGEFLATVEKMHKREKELSDLLQEMREDKARSEAQIRELSRRVGEWETAKDKVEEAERPAPQPPAVPGAHPPPPRRPDRK